MIFLWCKHILGKIIRLETWSWDFPERVTCQFRGDRKRLEGVLSGKVANRVTKCAPLLFSCPSSLPRACCSQAQLHVKITNVYLVFQKYTNARSYSQPGFESEVQALVVGFSFFFLEIPLVIFMQS